VDGVGAVAGGDRKPRDRGGGDVESPSERRGIEEVANQAVTVKSASPASVSVLLSVEPPWATTAMASAASEPVSRYRLLPVVTVLCASHSARSP